MAKPGFYEGQRYTKNVDEVEQLISNNKLEDAEKLLIELVSATENEAKVVKQSLETSLESYSIISNGLSQSYVSNSNFNFNFNSYSNKNLSLPQLEFTQDELEAYTISRKVVLRKAAIPWINTLQQSIGVQLMGQLINPLWMHYVS
jgi:hypothetical protein